jgi:hypothetical protein
MSQTNNTPTPRLLATLQINMYEYEGSVTYGGDMGSLAREISRICLENEEFAIAMNTAMLVVNDELTALRLRDEMIGMING